MSGKAKDGAENVLAFQLELFEHFPAVPHFGLDSFELEIILLFNGLNFL